jgi:hypothetical protein
VSPLPIGRNADGDSLESISTRPPPPPPKRRSAQAILRPFGGVLNFVWGAAYSQPRAPNAAPKAQSGPFYGRFGPIFLKRHSQRYADAARNGVDVRRREIQPPDSYKLLK